MVNSEIALDLALAQSRQEKLPLFGIASCFSAIPLLQAVHQQGEWILRQMRPELIESCLDGDGKAQPFKGSPNFFFGVNAQHLSLCIYQRASAVAWIDLGIGLDKFSLKS